MRTIFFKAVVLCTLFLMHAQANAQVPAGMNYQTIVRDADGDIVANREISLRFSITNGPSGAVLYRESHSVVSNEFGLVTLSIGLGDDITGEFADIPWNSGNPWLRVEMDPNGGNTYINMGTSRLLSVPYALYAATAQNGLVNGSEIGNTPFWNGTLWVTNSSNIHNDGVNVGINTTMPLGKLHLKGSENISQLIVDGSPDQDNAHPLIKLRRSSGLELLWIHSDDPSNAFIGIEAGLSNSGTDNTGVGAGALKENTTGSLNTAIGLHALYLNTIGSGNTAMGIDALYNNTQGQNNIAIGNFALNANLQGLNNAAVGVNALKSATTGNQNTATGANALQKSTTGNGNTAVGFDAMADNTMGSFRTALGVNSNSAGSGFNNNTALGYNTICSASNQVRIGNSEVTSIGGFADWTNVSDGRFKRNITDDVVGLDFINALRPVTYTMDLHAIAGWWAENYGLRDASLAVLGYEKEKIVYSGFVAQEVEEAARSLGYEFSGVDTPKNEKDYYGLRYGTFVVPLVKAVQELAGQVSGQQQLIEELRKENADLREQNAQQLASQQEQINSLQSMLSELKAAIEMR